MTTTEQITELTEHIKKVCRETQCRMLFVTYFDGGAGDGKLEGPAISASLGIPQKDMSEVTNRAWYAMNKACNMMEPRECE